jgi:hypothetical protein
MFTLSPRIALSTVGLMLVLASPASARPPNIVLIVFDDLGYGDFDGSGVVGGPDWIRIWMAYPMSAGDDGFDPDLDLNGDELMGSLDPIGVQRGHGQAPGPSGLH